MSSLEDRLGSFLEERKKEVVPVLRKFAEDEGYVFRDFGSADPITLSKRYWLWPESCKKEVAFFGRAQLRKILPNEEATLQPMESGVLLKKVDRSNAATDRGEGNYARLKVESVETMTKQRVVNWLKDVTGECIVCFEEKPTHENLKKIAKNTRIMCFCGALTCFGCRLDLILIRLKQGDGFTVECPNCRKVEAPIGNLQMFYDVLVATPSLEGLSEAQLALIKKYSGYDGSAKALSLSAVRRKQQFLSMHSCMCDECKRETRCKRHKKISATATVSVTPLISADSCANCGKSFWDKKERQRAPKCPKCKRTFYCTAKCRKAHRKKHSQLCAAAMKQKKKKHKKARKASCDPY